LNAKKKLGAKLKIMRLKSELASFEGVASTYTMREERITAPPKRGVSLKCMR
jgi:hypothetical protein